MFGISIALTFYCNSHTGNCVLFFLREIVCEFPVDILISTLCHIHCNWIFSYRPLCVAKYAHLNPPFGEILSYISYIWIYLGSCDTASDHWYFWALWISYHNKQGIHLEFDALPSNGVWHVAMMTIQFYKFHIAYRKIIVY